MQQYVANGERLAEEGDLCSALAWLAEALDLDHGDPERERAHRSALHSLLRQVPQSRDVWILPELVNPGGAAEECPPRCRGLMQSSGRRRAQGAAFS